MVVSSDLAQANGCISNGLRIQAVAAIKPVDEKQLIIMRVLLAIMFVLIFILLMTR